MHGGFLYNERVEIQLMNKAHYRIGILGGMGPLAGVHLQKLIIQYTPAVIDQDHIQVLCFTNPHIPDRMRSLKEDGGEVFSDAIVESLRVLEAGQVDCILIPCNTSHVRFEKIQAATRVPVLNMIQLALRTIDASHASSVGLLATEGTIASKVFESGNRFQWILPDAEHQKEVLRVIADIKARRSDEADITARIQKAVDHLLEKSAGKVILGCTELSIYSEFMDAARVIDPLTELAKEAVRLAHAAEA
jgi:aspartate racemase